jgi:group I intron endonuclease
MMHYIYKITNLINKNIYIGYTSRQISRRFMEHCQESTKRNRQLIARAIAKNGAENFVIEELAACDNKESALLLEQEYIASLQTNRSRFPNGIGYNLHDGGNVPPCHKGKTWPNRRAKGTRPKPGYAGRVYSAESRQKLNEKTIGKTIEQIYGENKAKIIREKMRAAKQKTTYVATEEHRQKLSASRKGYEYSEEGRINIRKGQLNKWIKVTFTDGSYGMFRSNKELGNVLGFSYSVVSRMVHGLYRLPDNVVSMERCLGAE